MRIKITADSTCDLSEELLAQWDIALMPMHILMGEDSYLDGVTIHPADVFAYVNAGGKMPKSAAPNLVEYTDFLAPFARDYDAVIHINVGSKFSSCFQNARLAAQEFDNVYVVDSENICTGQGYLVLQAAKWAADGLPPKNISMRLQGLAKRVELSFVLNQLDYMAKSGRCSGVLAFGANILGIKPSLAVIDGELKVVRKYRGSLPTSWRTGRTSTTAWCSSLPLRQSPAAWRPSRPDCGSTAILRMSTRPTSAPPSAAIPVPVPSASCLHASSKFLPAHKKDALITERVFFA